MVHGQPCPGEADASLHVAAAVIIDGAGRVLIALRPERLHQGGLWEFPGGKVEPGEARRDALVRELREELGIEVEAARPLIRVHHAYPDRRVLLDVWRVAAFRGEAHGREGQPVRWVAAEELPAFPFPAANLPIVSAARLPPLYLITPEPGPEADWHPFLRRLEERVAAGIRLVQLRAHGLEPSAYERLARRVREVCHRGGARLLLNGPPELAPRLGADGIHLTSLRLRELGERPLGKGFLVAGSCHSAEDLERAGALGLDFAVLSPVHPTASHPGATLLGWSGFAPLAEAASLPVYALGGVAPRDLESAWEHGAQGIAAIRGLWDAPPETIARGVE